MIDTPRVCALGIALSLCWSAGAQDEPEKPVLHAADYAMQLNAVPDPELLRGYHDLLASAPHDSGTPGDKAVVENLAELFESFGLMVEKQELQLYLSEPVSAEVRVFAADLADEGLELSLREMPVEGDSFVGDERLRAGWNAYGATGDVTGQVVYANHGRLEDFERLEELGVSCEGKVVICRYGGNFRGYKAKYAQEAGAAGLIIYTDPKQDGWGRGVSWPEGGYANGTHIQRGSILTLDYAGDPLTPFEVADADARRVSPEGVALPKIPVQPMGWDAAREILSRMTGSEVPGEWQGGLGFRYRVTGGEDLTVRVAVEQERRLTTTWNVIGTLVGETEPEREVIIGAHHDSWGFGASDSMSGLICVVEAARAFGELAAQGVLPRRTVRFVGWAAEEHGLMGSTEYVESRAKELSAGAVAYINLDMAAMGPNFGASASPSLRGVVGEASRHVPQARAAEESVWQNWVKDAEDEHAEPSIGNLGGGSDHVGFLCHVCVPSISMSSGGSRGTSYHSSYDNLDWYRAVVGEDYEPALMITRMAVGVAARLAHERVLPLSPDAYGHAVAEQMIGMKAGDSIGESEMEIVRSTVVAAMPRNTEVAVWAHMDVGELNQDQIDQINRELMAIERAWCAEGFDDGRPWYRNGFVAPDATSGYAAWVLPGIQRALFTEDAEHLAVQAAALAEFGKLLQDRTQSIWRLLDQVDDEVLDGESAPDPAGGRFQLETISISPIGSVEKDDGESEEDPGE